MGIQTSTINNGPVAGFKNKVINGNFDFWQRNTTFTLDSNSNGTYMADRWVYAIGTGWTGLAATASRQAFSLGQTDVPDNPKYFLRINQTVAGTTPAPPSNYKDLIQHVEDVTLLAGKQVTLSFYAKAASALTLPSVSIQQNFGTGGTPSAATFNLMATNISIGTTWAFYSYTITLPSASGKTLGTNNNDFIDVDFGLPLTGAYTLDLARIQLEEGPVATDFEQRPLGTELALCQRYCYNCILDAQSSASPRGWVTESVDVGASSFAGSPYVIVFPVEMRSAPSVSPALQLFKSSGAGPAVFSADVRVNAQRCATLPYFFSASASSNQMYMNASTYLFSAEL